MTSDAFDEAVEALLVARDLRGMARVRAALKAGYVKRAAKQLYRSRRVMIGTGFPVAGTFETDGPVGSIALYRSLEGLGAQCWLVCAEPLCRELSNDFRVLPLLAFTQEAARKEAARRLAQTTPDTIVSIERPGRAADGAYYNMRGEDISADCGIFDPYLEQADCPTIAVGDGGNEIGMGNVADIIGELDIIGSATTCDELLVADVSNWGAYGIIAYLGLWSGRELLADIQPRAILAYLSSRGSVDGVSRENTLTEDGLDAAEGESVIAQLQRLTADPW
ncbi:MAG: glutamate cyclase domain-containing protein [Chromatocurvus sp.]